VAARALGLGRGAIRHRIGSGRLHRVLPRVYAVGHEILTVEGRFMAATLYCGAGAALSHRSAAHHWGLLASAAATVDISCPRQRRSTGTVRVHEMGSLRPADLTTHEAIPVTTVARTLLDLAEVAPPRHVERALDQAEVLRRFDLRAVDEVLARAHGRRGAPVLRAALDEHGRGPSLTRSELEEAFLALVRASDLPRPRLNARVAGFEVDAYWPAQRLAVELDGAAYHHTPRAFEGDRRRDIALLKAGVRTARVTRRRLGRDPQEVVADLRALLVDSSPAHSS
jgi:very-short-patch-repair endonuclease